MSLRNSGGVMMTSIRGFIGRLGGNFQHSVARKSSLVAFVGTRFIMCKSFEIMVLPEWKITEC